ncbi:hypothetical protein GO491_10185 [Flavobacteriaceae bacterium Ap0902]|nr:hypothetical protein [Flavobacteriaceae bacterium Ap0902]
MIRYLLILTVFCFLLLNCEDDDICVEQTTPRLNLRFNQITPDKVMDSLIIYRENREGEFDLITRRLVIDSIQVSLPVEERSQARFIIGTRTFDSSNQDTLTINYEYTLQFISKACGYGVNYLNTSYDITNHYFNSIDTLQNEITSETADHIMLNY